MEINDYMYLCKSFFFLRRFSWYTIADITVFYLLPFKSDCKNKRKTTAEKQMYSMMKLNRLCLSGQVHRAPDFWPHLSWCSGWFWTRVLWRSQWPSGVAAGRCLAQWSPCSVPRSLSGQWSSSRGYSGPDRACHLK